MNHCELTTRDTLTPLPESVTVCATVDESGREQVVTELMISRACELLDSEQLWPFTGTCVHHAINRVLPATSAVILPFSQG